MSRAVGRRLVPRIAEWSHAVHGDCSRGLVPSLLANLESQLRTLGDCEPICEPGCEPVGQRELGRVLAAVDTAAAAMDAIAVSALLKCGEAAREVSGRRVVWEYCSGRVRVRVRVRVGLGWIV